MSQDVYSNPPAGPDAASRVSTPATIMLAIAAISILGNIAGIVMNLAGVGMGGFARGMGQQERMAQMFSGGLGLLSAFVGIVLNAVVIFGAMKMKSLESYTLAMVAAIIATLPCSCCCILNTPFGIWSLVVLFDQNVKAAFRS